MNQVATQQPLGELFAELATETGTLVRKEIELAKVEVTEKVKLAGKEATYVAIGAAVCVLGLLALMASAIFALGLIIPMWASALVVGAIVLGTGGALALHGMRALKGMDAKPRQFLQTIQEDKQWLKDQVSR